MNNYFYNKIKKGKLILALMLLCMGFSQVSFSQVQKVERHAPPMGQMPQEQNQMAISYDDEIKVDEIPEQVTSSLDDNYSEYEISEVFRGSDGSYKVKLKKGKEKVAAFYDAGGEFIRVENDTDDKETINDDWR